SLNIEGRFVSRILFFQLDSSVAQGGAFRCPQDDRSLRATQSFLADEPNSETWKLNTRAFCSDRVTTILLPWRSQSCQLHQPIQAFTSKRFPVGCALSQGS